MLGQRAEASGDESCNDCIQGAQRQGRSGKAADQNTFDLAHEGRVGRKQEDKNILEIGSSTEKSAEAKKRRYIVGVTGSDYAVCRYGLYLRKSRARLGGLMGTAHEKLGMSG